MVNKVRCGLNNAHDDAGVPERELGFMGRTITD
jgi:hypothetical protein